MFSIKGIYDSYGGIEVSQDNSPTIIHSLLNYFQTANIRSEDDKYFPIPKEGSSLQDWIKAIAQGRLYRLSWKISFCLIHEEIYKLALQHFKDSIQKEIEERVLKCPQILKKTTRVANSFILGAYSSVHTIIPFKDMLISDMLEQVAEFYSLWRFMHHTRRVFLPSHLGGTDYVDEFKMHEELNNLAMTIGIDKEWTMLNDLQEEETEE